MPRYLLDKNISRRIIEALFHLNHLSLEERLVLELWRQLQQEQSLLVIPVGTVNTLQRVAHLLEVRAFLETVEPLESGRYLKRWARRLRDHGFTREDALILALTTFGTSATTDTLGVEGLITLDQPFINNFRVQQPILEKRLQAMTRQLSDPYHRAHLPAMLHPREILV